MGKPDLAISRSSGQNFPAMIPVRVDYQLSFMLTTDFMVLELGIFEDLVLQPDEELKVTLTPPEGDVIEFTGIPYAVATLTSKTHVRMTLVNKHVKKLAGTQAAHGSGNTADIIASLYRQAGISRVDLEKSDTSLETVIFPKTWKLSDSVQYLLNRSPAKDAYLMATVVGDSAYVRSIKSTVKPVGDLMYTLDTVKDDRKRVDIRGGIKLSVAGDEKNIKKQSLTLPGTNEVDTNLFYGFSVSAVNRARARVKQAKAYYGGYVALVNVLGALPLLGGSFTVRDQDAVNNDIQEPKGLFPGRYFIYSQALTFNFQESFERSLCGLMLVE